MERAKRHIAVRHRLCERNLVERPQRYRKRLSAEGRDRSVAAIDEAVREADASAASLLATARSR